MSGLGMDNWVAAIASVGNDVYVGGAFTRSGAVTTNHIARWNGFRWSALGDGVNGTVYALAVVGSDLYAGGEFTTAGGVTAVGIAKWDGTNWSAVGSGNPSGSGLNGTVKALAVSGTTLYAGGSFTTADGASCSRIAKWDGTAWSPLGAGVGDDEVMTMAVDGNDLYVGGSLRTAGGVNVKNIAKWNGSSWSALGAGLNRRVFGLAVIGSTVYAAGEFGMSGLVSTRFLATWDGTAWSEGLGSASGDVHDLTRVGNGLLAVGDVWGINGVPVNFIGKWNGANWSSFGSGLNGVTVAATLHGNDLWIGGQFTTAGGAPSVNIAVYHPNCGDGVVDFGEACDDGNADNGDGCFSNCSTTCGNGVTAGGEACDDGNVASGDGCDANCTATACGNGLVTAGEACDDGNASNDDLCRNDCTVACGDGVTASWEACDDGNATDGDGCDSNCKPTGCGNSIVTAGEQCDDGNLNPTDACTDTCQVAFCGDGITRVNEWCDDGNASDEDSCLTTCQWNTCQDGHVNVGVEGCDDGNAINDDGCDANCTVTGCGNGILNSGETCDDGNLDDADGCLSTCVPNTCQDGHVNVGVESCDDGNGTSGDGCDANCSLTGCGNGIVTAGEDCDDGNAINTDGCFSNCRANACVDAPYSQISIGMNYGCGVRPDGSADCWGSNANGQAAPPAGSFTRIAGFVITTCAIRTDSTIACWGSNTDNAATPPAGTFTRIATGGGHSCAIRSNGTVACWGLNQYGQTTAPVGTFTTISAYGYHSCGIRSDGTLSCWGWNAYGQTNAPAGTYVAVAGGGAHNCAIRTDGTVACWGLNNAGQTGAPAGTFTQLGAGFYHTCGVRTDGSVACWGMNNDGQSTPPAGTFLEVGGGEYHTCGLRSDNIVRCWGRDNFGQSRPCVACGDGLVSGREPCDDGNSSQDDRCLLTCQLNVCGDGYPYAGVESCDDGNAVNGDACDTNCTLPGCGNGIVDGGEDCDDGNASEDDACLTSCAANVCGDGHRNVGVEACDDGAANGMAPDACRPDCTAAGCGDGVLDSGETCDDGNAVTTDACVPACQPNVCGDGFVHAGVEPCDDGNGVDTDACLAGCVPNVCGDGITNNGVEQCDDGNATNGDGCDAGCLWSYCGNGVLAGNEECDDGNGQSGDGCDANCRPTGCGNGLRWDGEECDDGNTESQDGCEPTCTRTPGQLDPTFDGDGIVFGAVADDDNFASVRVAVLTGGRVVAAYSGNGPVGSWFELAGYTTDGVPDPGFGTGGVAGITIGDDGYAHALAVQADQKLVVVGTVYDGAGSHLALARFSSSGVPDATFGIGGAVLSGIVQSEGGAVAVAADGSIVAAGGDPSRKGLLARFHPDGSVDTAFGSGGVAVDPAAPEVRSMALQPDGKIVTVGVAAGTREVVLSRYNASGSIDAAFGSGGRRILPTSTGWNAVVGVQPDGRIVVAADVATGYSFDLGVFRFLADGSIDSGFAGDGNLVLTISDDDESPRAVIFGPDHKITIAGWIYRDGRETFVARLRPDGSVDNGFAPSGYVTLGVGEYWNRGTDVALQPDGKTVVAGDGSYDGWNRVLLLRYLSGTCGDRRAQVADGEQCDDGNATGGDGCETDCTRTPVVEVAAAGETVSTDPLHEGATPSSPVQTALETPNAGTVSIATPPEPVVPEGMEVVGYQLQIEAPPATVAEPLRITLTVDASAIPPGVEASRLDVTRDGIVIGDCTGPAGTASPDPCIERRTLLAGGDVELAVLTSHASLWGVVLRGLVADEQDCVNAIGKATLGVAKAQAKWNASCLKAAVAGADLEACAAADTAGKVDKSMAKTAGVALDKCVPPPPFAFTNADAVNSAALQAELDLLADLLGSNPSGAVVTGPTGAACQAAAMKSVQKLFETQAKAFLACLKSGLAGAGGPMVASEDVERCYGVVAADAAGKARKSAAALSSKVAKACTPHVAEWVAGDCGSAVDVGLCFDGRTKCRLCTLFDAAVGMEEDCDRFDNGAIDGSCP